MGRIEENVKAVAFDVDGTLTLGKKRPAETVGLLAQLASMVPVALISGSSYQALETKIVSELAKTGAPFDVYASGGSVRLTYGQGAPVYDPSYAADVRFPQSDIVKVRNIVQRTARDTRAWGDDIQEAFNFMNSFRDWAWENNEGYVWSHAQKWQIKITSPGEKDHQSAIRLEARHDPGGQRVVGLSIKSIPRVLDGQPTKFVGSLVNRLKLGMQEHYQIMPAGFASIDVNLGDCTKSRAIGHITERLNITPGQILYFGDEFGEYGNDRTVRNAGVDCIDVSDGGPAKTVDYLKSLLIKHD